jgi:ubiquinol-cytochrome c reductase iron-sulfur subunit
MNDNANPPAEEGDGHHAANAPVRLDEGHVIGSGGIPERFEDPGLPPHVHRMSDVDPRAARKAELQVAVLFGVSILASIGFIAAYAAIPDGTYTYVPGIGHASLLHIMLGVTMGISLLGIGFGAVHWAKTLMPDEEVVEERHPQRSPQEKREGTVKTLFQGAEAAQITRRPLIKYTLGGALGLFALPFAVQLVGGLGPLPHDWLSTSFWKKGMRLVRDPEMTPVKVTDVTIGSAYHILPEGIDEAEDFLEQKTKAAVLLMRLDPTLIESRKERDWGYHGIVAYSQICTHVGCPVGLYEQTTHHLLCPCHQSTFDVTKDCEVIFGPAGRPLPQLPITVDDEGYLTAADSFQEAVGPSYWERG